MKKKDTRIDLMLRQFSFVGGMGSVLNIYGNHFDFEDLFTEENADANAIHSDWCAVGRDIQNASDTFGKTLPPTEKE